MWDINSFPDPLQVETVPVLKQCARAHRYLAELKGGSQSIPNQGILISTLVLQEAKDSSEIENIVTTHDELYKQDLFPDIVTNLAAKEVHDYSTALREGYSLVCKNGLITRSTILKIHRTLEKNDVGYRKLPGTALVNDSTGATVYTPPQSATDVERLMTALEAYINDETVSSLDPLVRMAVIHHQFESIHPFYDGNGRTGRIINVLYLVMRGLLDIPILYLSRYFIKTKSEYYRLLQATRDTGDWEPWIFYVLSAVEKTAQFTLRQVECIKKAQLRYKHAIREKHPEFYSQDLINNLFNHPYTKIDFLMRELGLKSRITATKYLDMLCDDGLLAKKKVGRSNYYINLSILPIISMEGQV